MTIQRLRLTELRIPFKTAFRHASAERHETSSIWAEAISSDGGSGYGEACPRPYVTGETLDTARAFFHERERSLRAEVVDLDSLRAWSLVNSSHIDQNPAAWCAMELAVLDLMAKAAGQTLEGFLSLPPLTGRFRYTAVLGDASDAAFTSMADGYRRMGFSEFKVKLSGDTARDRAKVAALRALDLPGLRVRVDANNLWPNAESAVPYLKALDYPFAAIEEPIRAQQYSELAHIAQTLDCPVVLDESFVRLDQLGFLEDAPQQWLINVRVSKMGGIERSLAVILGARARGIRIIVGAQVGETSLLTRAALTVAQAAGADLVAQEGAFGTFLLEHDICEPPLMFGAGGVLDVAEYGSLCAPGLGLRISSAPILDS